MKVPAAQIQPVIQAMQRKGYVLFDRPWSMNLVGVRSANRKADSFDDKLYVFYRDSAGQLHAHLFDYFTTDPGLAELQNPSFPEAQRGGTAILAQGQYRRVYAIGRHGDWVAGWGHPALIQVAPLRVYRDNNRDNLLDKSAATITEGMYGINIHASVLQGRAPKVGRNSAGCQVFGDADQYREWWSLMQLQVAHGLGSTFTYTLLDESDYV